jgi:hypothetical protein
VPRFALISFGKGLGDAMQTPTHAKPPPPVVACVLALLGAGYLTAIHAQILTRPPYVASPCRGKSGKARAKDLWAPQGFAPVAAGTRDQR